MAWLLLIPVGLKHAKVLFVCSQNKLRSPTAEKIYTGVEDLQVKSCGIYFDAPMPLSAELVEWADVIFAMEKGQRDKLRKKFRALVKDKRVITLYIPDEYEFTDPELIRILKSKIDPYIGIT